MDTSSGDTAAISSIVGGFFLCYILFILLILAFTVFVYYKIFQKTGNSGWMALLMLVPLVNLGMFLYLAFSDWPILRENRDLRARLGYPTADYPSPGGYGPPTPPYSPTPAPYAPPPYSGQPAAPQAPPYSGPPSGPQIPPEQPPTQP